MKKITPDISLFERSKYSIDWESWLSQYEENLREADYRKYIQHHKRETFAYWKSFYNTDNTTKIYQVGVLFYDFRPYAQASSFPERERIGVMYNCMLLGGSRIDLEVSKEMDLTEFEIMSRHFYESMVNWV